MREIGDDAVPHLEVDGDGRAAELGMRRRRRVRHAPAGRCARYSRQSQEFSRCRRRRSFFSNLSPFGERSMPLRASSFRRSSNIYNAGAPRSTRQPSSRRRSTPLSGSYGRLVPSKRLWSVQLVPPWRGTTGDAFDGCRHQENHAALGLYGQAGDRPAERRRRSRRPSACCCAGPATIRTAKGLIDTPKRVAKAFLRDVQRLRHVPGRRARPHLRGGRRL